MIDCKITSNVEDAQDFVVNLVGKIERPKALNDALGRSLARMLQEHFRERNKEPNKMQAPKTNFWNNIADATILSDVTDTGATVTIGDARFRIHLKGGKILPTGGRKWLTIPLTKASRGKRVSEYENSTGKKLFRVGRALVERSDEGDRTLVGGRKVTVRKRSGFKQVGLRPRSQIRAIYALAREANIPRDPKALPATKEILTVLNDAAQKWLVRESNRTKKGGRS